MGIFESIFGNFDQTSWLLFGLLVAALVAYYFWPEHTKAQAEVHRDEETRKKAKSLIALAHDDVDDKLFELEQVPLRIRPGGKLKSALASGTKLDAEEICEALWTQQRALITRLESELDYAQQADVSSHFAIAAPANQPGSLLEKTLKELEAMLGQIRKQLQIADDRPLWHGRAMVLMMSNRKLFDHVAWLTGAGLASSAPGAFTLASDDIVMITLYATRLGGFARQLTLQVSRAAVLGEGGPALPKWVEYGVGVWLADKLLGAPVLAKGEEAPRWSEGAISVLDPGAWREAMEDSTKLERLVGWSAILVAAAMQQQCDRLLADLRDLRQGGEAKNFDWADEIARGIPAEAPKTDDGEPANK